ncbi:hypothetical protein [Raoultella ornithinolytica]|uniref:hypothetical protein n=1 Tax=Raoultella ornithinolytica TaxID=54291 RepID=UPI001C7D6BCB|nr:hypothetical protein [Raoultella ornithinolytica]
MGEERDDLAPQLTRLEKSIEIQRESLTAAQQQLETPLLYQGESGSITEFDDGDFPLWSEQRNVVWT